MKKSPIAVRSAVLVAVVAAAQAGLASAQPYDGAFVLQGPTQTIGDANTVQSRDAPPDTGKIAGAVQSILVDPTNSASMIIGTPNGGIWTTQNGGASWTPVSDKLTSLSIASLAYDSTDPKTVYAGIGNTDNGYVGAFVPSRKSSGPLIGIVQSKDGGNTWKPLEIKLGDMVDQSVVAVAGSTTSAGATIFAATSEPNDMGKATGLNKYGLYRSVNGDAFQLVNDGSGSMPPKGTATSLVGQGTRNAPYYVFIKADDTGESGIFRSDNNGGTWSRVERTPTGQAGRLALSGNGAVAVVLYDPSPSPASKVTGLRLSQTGESDTWTKITNFPTVTPGGQANTDLAVAIDPTNSNIVYLAGDRNESSAIAAVSAFRIITNGSTTAIVQSMTESGIYDNSTIHADARAIAFDASGRLIMASDGGIYSLSSPKTLSGTWSSLNGNLSVREPYVIAYDSISKRLAVAAQDAGVGLQDGRGQLIYRPWNGGDGFVAAVNDKTYAADKESILYTSSQSLLQLYRTEYSAVTGYSRREMMVEPKSTQPGWNFVLGDKDTTDFTNGADLPMPTLFVLNRRDPTKIAIGSNYLYTTTDKDIVAAADTPCAATSTGCNILTNVSGTRVGLFTAIAYGAPWAENALLAGTYQNKLYFSAAGDKNSLKSIDAYPGQAPTSLLFGPSRYVSYVADGTNLYSSAEKDGTFSFQQQTENVSKLNIGSPTSLEFIDNNGVKALLVGGINVATDRTAPTQAIAVAKSNDIGVLSNWAPFGLTLPNTFVNAMTYSVQDDVLFASLYGRGVWSLYDVTSYFSEATVLQFGKADNDSIPVGSQLTGKSRSLVKYGSGTLTITPTANATYEGKTTVLGGKLLVNGSLAQSSSVEASAGSTVSGTGTLPQTVIANASLAPGNGTIGSSMTIQNSLTFDATSSYTVAVTLGAASFANVVPGRIATGTANLNGTVNALLQPGSYLHSAPVRILSTAGGFSDTAFSGVKTNMPFLVGTMSYSPTEAFITIAPGGFAQGGQTANQVAVGTALDRSVSGASDDYATVINALSAMSSSTGPTTFDQLSGQGYTGFSTLAVQTAQFFMNTFAQQVGGAQTVGRGGGSGRIALAEACDVACDASPARWGAWGAGIGGLGSLAGNGNAYGLTYNIGGFAAGIDYQFTPNATAGVTVGYTRGNSYTSGLSGNGTANTVQFGAYGTFSFDAAYVDLLGGYARSSNAMVRQIFVPGLDGRTAFGNNTQDQFFGQLEAGYRFNLGGPSGTFLTPFARLQGSTATASAFTEWGAQSIDLSVASQTTNSLRTIFGGQFGGTIPDIGLDGLSAVLRLGWAHEYASTARPMTASFAGAPAFPFTVQGATMPTDSLLLGFSASTRIGESTSLFARYEGELASGFNNQAFTAGVRMTW